MSHQKDDPSGKTEETGLRIRAAGAVLWRRNPTDKGLEIALVHRPEYDDWSLPKGKAEKGETLLVTAVREVREETGFSSALRQHLGTISYRPQKQPQAHKTVDYFSAEAREGHFKASKEIDKMLWLSPKEAKAKLTLSRDIQIIEAFRALPSNTQIVVLVRHAKAGKREDWTGDDDLRPLSPAGLRQAEAIRAVAAVFRPDRVFAAPRTRCVETVRAVAKDAAVDIHEEPRLSEDGYWAEPRLAQKRLMKIAMNAGVSVVCSQGGVIPDLVRRLAEKSDLSLFQFLSEKPLPSKKGSLWVLSFQAKHEGEPHMVAADYYPTALPHPANLF